MTEANSLAIPIMTNPAKLPPKTQLIVLDDMNLHKIHKSLKDKGK